MGAILERLERLYGRFTDGDDGERPSPKSDGGTTSAEPEGSPPSDLYQCPACETVFVAREKRTCEACGRDVELVTSTDPDATCR